MVIFGKVSEIYIEDDFVKIQEFTLVIIFVIFSEKTPFRLENEIFEISWNLAYSYFLSKRSHFVTTFL